MSSGKSLPPRGHPWPAPCFAPKPQRPSSLLARKRDLILNGGSPSFIRFPRPIQGPSVAACSFYTADNGAVADYPPSTSDYRSSGSLSSDHVPLSAPISDSPLKYDVFISFRGPDSYDHFVSHLYKDLCQRDIETFIDRRKLERGDDFEPELSDAIDRSRISIVVLTNDFASSRWCLRELARIMECRKSRNQVVLPVFLDVEPMDVRWQKGNYGVAFSKHDKAPEGSPLAQEVKLWRKALKDVAGIYGFHSKDVGSGSNLVEKIAEHVLEKLEHNSLFEDDEGLVGAYSQVKKVEELLENGSAEVQTLGICGINGSGKTTIAGAVFDRLHQKFNSCCFLTNVKDEAEKHGLPRLRNELFRHILGQVDINIATPEIRSSSIRNRLRRKKVLIVLDDIGSLTQLELLIKSPTYFGPGSRIIITTEDKKVLMNVDKKYYVKPLSDIGSLELFSQYAFKESYPPEDYLRLSMRTAEYAKGLPLTLKVMGSLVRNTIKESVLEWESALGKLETSLDDETFKILRISYDGLNDEEKSIFLHLACFFNGEQRSHITSLLEGSGFSAHIGIRTLVDKCMITFTDERLQVHDLFRKMATQIVRQESYQDPSKRSRLLSFDEIHEVLTENTGTKSTEAISLDLSEKEKLQIGRHAFAGMRNLKFLRVSYKHSNDESCKTHLPEGLDFPPRLRLFFWDHFPLRTLSQSFIPDNLVEVRMRNSRVERLWGGVKSLNNLKRIDLSYSRFLKELPDFSNAPKVERIVARGCAELVTIPTPTDKLKFLDLLDLSGCSKLTNFPVISWNIKRLFLADSGIEEIPPSLANFHQLVDLDMRGCKMLKNTAQIGPKLEKLEYLNLSGCSSVTNFPDFVCNVKELLLNETSIEEIPSSIKSMGNLELLELKNCPGLTSLPTSIVELQSLVELNLSGSSNFTNFPEIAETMDSLKYLSLSGSAIKELPSSLENLAGLYSLDLENCNSLISLPDLSKLKFLMELNISGCSNLVNLSECSRNLGSLVNIRASGCRSEVVDYLGAGLSSLRTLELSDCGISEFPEALTLIPALTELDLSHNCFSTIPPSIKNLQELQSLDLSHCHELQSLSGVPAGLTRLNLLNCRSLETVSLSNSSELLLYPFNNVETIVFADCHSLSQYAIDNIKAFAKRRIHVLASHLRVILNFRGADLSLNSWMKPQEQRYVLSSMYGYGNLHEALIGLHKAFFSDELISKETPSRVLSRLLHDFHERCRLSIEDNLHLFSLIAHLYLYYQGKPSTNFCLPGTDIPEWFCHQSNGSFIAVIVQPPESSNESTLVGFAISVLVAFDGYNDDKGISIRYECHFHSISFGTRDGEGYLRGWDGKKGKPSSIEGDHLFLGFDSSILFDADNGIEQFVGYSEDLVKATFQCYVVDEEGNPINSCTLKKCAIQPLYTSNLAKSPKQILSRQDVTEGLTTSSSEFLGKVLRHLDLYGAISLGIMNVLGDLSVEIINQGGYVYIIVNCKNADLLVGLQILNVHLGTAPLAVKLSEMAEQSQDPRTFSVEYADVDGGDFSCRIRVKKCEFRPLQNHVMLLDRSAIT